MDLYTHYLSKSVIIESTQLITAFDKVVNAEHYTTTYISADNDSTVGVNSVEFKKKFHLMIINIQYHLT